MLYSVLLVFVAAFWKYGGCWSDDLLSNIISMPVTDTSESDTYMCLITSVNELKGESFVGFDIDSTFGVAHHVSIALVEDFNSKETLWDCRAQQGHISSGRLVTLGGKDGTDVEHFSMDLGDDIGLPMGKDTNLNYVLFQVHYKDPIKVSQFPYPTVNLTVYTTNERRPYEVQKLLLGSTGYVPANSPMFSSEISYKWEGGPVSIVSYHMHTHNYGSAEEGYLIRDGLAMLIGRKKITPHANIFETLDHPLEVKHGDIIAARCIYNNNETFPVMFGVTYKDEMCNFGINYKYPIGIKDYEKSKIFVQNAQNNTWCSETVPGTRVLCDQTDM